MLQISQFRIPIHHTDDQLRKSVSKALDVRPDKLGRIKIKQRAVDARKRTEILFCYTLLVEVREEDRVLHHMGRPGRIERAPDESYRELEEVGGAVSEGASVDPSSPAAPGKAKPSVVVVGTGPCGLFCGLLLARQGYNPILLERGKA
ncbi:MAG TPA: FAD-dependent monooxygenase, partial [Verrucomicrobium sp.]|nr:FAD-dependent monooxygenase [Verrucomicrobium sp.]